MIKYEYGTVSYKVQQGTWYAPWIEHAATSYGFLLNKPERQGRWHTWSDFADFMESYSSHVAVKLFAEHVRAEGKAPDERQ